MCLMCTESQLPRFYSFYHRADLDSEDNIALDLWMNLNIPDHIRVISVMRDQLDPATIVYEIIGELDPNALI